MCYSSLYIYTFAEFFFIFIYFVVILFLQLRISQLQVTLAVLYLNLVFQHTWSNFQLIL